MNWPATRVVVTGGGGFLGSVVVTQLRERGCRDVVALIALELLIAAAALAISFVVNSKKKEFV